MPFLFACAPLMEQARKRNSIEGRRHSAWPTAVRAVILFAPSDDRPTGVIKGARSEKALLLALAEMYV